jgi:intein-encoded DNA endonuclease-like protein
MEMVEWAKKGSMMNIKENFYIYQFNHFNKVIQEQKHIRKSDNQSSLFDIVVRSQRMPTIRSLNARL